MKRPWTPKMGTDWGFWRCPSCGRRIYDFRDHLPRCPALGRPNLQGQYTSEEIIGTLRIRVRALEAENARLGLVNGNAWRQRAEKAEAALAAAKRETDVFAEAMSREERFRRKAEAALAALSAQVLQDHRVGTTGYGLTMHMARAAGRESGGGESGVGVVQSPGQGHHAAAKSAARPSGSEDTLVGGPPDAFRRRRSAEDQECGT